MRQAIIETATGKVVNVIELEPGAAWTPPAGHTVRLAATASPRSVAGPGDTWDGTRFNKAADPAPTPTEVSRASAIVKLQGLGLTRAEIAALLQV